MTASFFLLTITQLILSIGIETHQPYDQGLIRAFKTYYEWKMQTRILEHMISYSNMWSRDHSYIQGLLSTSWATQLCLGFLLSALSLCLFFLCLSISLYLLSLPSISPKPNLTLNMPACCLEAHPSLSLSFFHPTLSFTPLSFQTRNSLSL